MLILASASNPRSKLLLNGGFRHKIIPSNIVEEKYFDRDIKLLVKLLSKEKAENVLKNIDYKLNSDCLIILGCDSLFEIEGKFFGKPKSEIEAYERLKLISNSSGFLHTGHCLLIKEYLNKNKNKNNKVFNSVISTKIEFSNIEDYEIQSYIKTGEPLKCAGGFSIDGAGGKFIRKIDGCFTNVIGLSMPWFIKVVKENNLYKFLE